MCRVQRSRCHDVHWPMSLSLRIAPGLTTRASGLRQRSAPAALKRNLKKAKRGLGPLAPPPPGATGSASEELALIAREDPGRSSGSWQTWPEAPGGRSSGSWQTSPSGSWQAQTWWSSQCWQKWPNERAMALRPRPGIRAPWSHALLFKTEHGNKGYMHTIIDSYQYTWIY